MSAPTRLALTDGGWEQLSAYGERTAIRDSALLRTPPASLPVEEREVIAAIAHAPEGEVAFHCVGGRDRSGQVAMLVLSMAGVWQDEIVADYLLSHERLRALYNGA